MAVFKVASAAASCERVMRAIGMPLSKQLSPKLESSEQANSTNNEVLQIWLALLFVT